MKEIIETRLIPNGENYWGEIETKSIELSAQVSRDAGIYTVSILNGSIELSNYLLDSGYDVDWVDPYILMRTTNSKLISKLIAFLKTIHYEIDHSNSVYQYRNTT